MSLKAVKVFETSRERTYKDNLVLYNIILTGVITARIQQAAVRISTYILAVVLKYGERSLT